MIKLQIADCRLQILDFFTSVQTDPKKDALHHGVPLIDNGSISPSS